MDNKDFDIIRKNLHSIINQSLNSLKNGTDNEKRYTYC